MELYFKSNIAVTSSTHLVGGCRAFHLRRGLLVGPGGGRFQKSKVKNFERPQQLRHEI